MAVLLLKPHVARLDLFHRDADVEIADPDRGQQKRDQHEHEAALHGGIGQLVAQARLDHIGADVLSDAAGLTRGNLGVPDVVKQRGLAMVDMTHDRYDRCARNLFAAFLLLIRQKHLGSDCLPGHIDRMVEGLRAKGVAIHTSEEVKDIIVDGDHVTGVLTKRGGKGHGLGYATMHLRLLVILAEIANAHGTDYYSHTGPQGENLLLPLEFYSAFYITHSPAAKGAYHAGDRLFMHKLPVFTIGNTRYPDSKAIQDVLAANRQIVLPSDELGYAVHLIYPSKPTKPTQ